MHALGCSLRLVSMGISTFFRIVHVLPDISFLLLPFGHILALCVGALLNFDCGLEDSIQQPTLWIASVAYPSLGLYPL